jgi:hypothetical protein
MKSLDLSRLVRTISWFLHRFHVTLFVVLAVGSLAVATLFLSQAITNQTTASTTDTDSNSFDTATMQRITTLHSSSDTSELQLPTGQRTNPFK